MIVIATSQLRVADQHSGHQQARRLWKDVRSENVLILKVVVRSELANFRLLMISIFQKSLVCHIKPL